MKKAVIPDLYVVCLGLDWPALIKDDPRVTQGLDLWRWGVWMPVDLI